MSIESGTGDASWQDAARARALGRGSRQASQPPQQVKRVALAVGVVVHLILLFAVREAMRPEPIIVAKGIQVEIYDAPAAVPPLPEPPAAAKPVRASVLATLPDTAHTAQSFTITANTSAADAAPVALPLFNPDGSIQLPATAKPTAHEAGLQRGRELLARGHNLLHCRRSAYDTTPTDVEQGNNAGRDAAMGHVLFDGIEKNSLAIKAAAALDIASSATMATVNAAVAEQACDGDVWSAQAKRPGAAKSD